MARPAGWNFGDIRLVDRANLSDGDKKAIIAEIIKLFRGISGVYCEMYPDAQMPLFQPTFHDGDLRPHDLRCFLFNTDTGSVARKLGAPVLGPGGTTFASTKGTVSEVYMLKFSIEVICKLIFHELMHNKLQMGNEMHTDWDVGFGLASDSVADTGMMNRSSSQINYRNQKAMATHLFDAVPQYPGRG